MRCLFFITMQDSSEYRFADDGVSYFFELIHGTGNFKIVRKTRTRSQYMYAEDRKGDRVD